MSVLSTKLLYKLTGTDRQKVRQSGMRLQKSEINVRRKMNTVCGPFLGPKVYNTTLIYLR